MLRFGKPKSEKANQNRDSQPISETCSRSCFGSVKLYKTSSSSATVNPNSVRCCTIMFDITVAVSSLVKLLFIGIIITNVMRQLFTMVVEYSPSIWVSDLKFSSSNQRFNNGEWRVTPSTILSVIRSTVLNWGTPLRKKILFYKVWPI
jgi:hypothetical protein